MILKKIIYLDASIKVCLVKTEREELTRISPDLVQYLTISYSIGLINDPSKKVEETIKIELKDIEFADKYLIVSFPFDGLNNPKNCEITISSLTFYLKNKPRYKVQIGETQLFRNIESDSTFIYDILKKVNRNKPTRIQKKATENTCNEPTKRKSPKEPDNNINNIKHFIDSYEKFKSQIQDSDIYKLIKNRPNTVDSNLKNFGISLLCKLLLLIKYVNELVDNDFQKDLHEFLRTQILDRLKMEVKA